MIELHNPYSARLGQRPVVRVDDRKVITHRGCNVWSYARSYHVYEKHGVIFTERVGAGTKAIDDFLDGSGLYSKRMQEAHAEWLEAIGWKPQQAQPELAL